MGLNGWFEHEPIGPYPAADTGGDYQVSDAYSRRWATQVRDGWALITVALYLEDLGQGDGPQLVTQTEYLLCGSLDDPGGTERWSECVYGSIDLGRSPVEADVFEQCARLDAADYCGWDGEPFEPDRRR